MAFCQNCGSALPDGAKFCTNCGTQTGEDKTKRREEYAGTVKKCPACGEILGALTALCPSCGFEVNGAETSKAVSDFIRELDALDKEIAGLRVIKTGWKSWTTAKRAAWLLLNLPTLGIPAAMYHLIPRMGLFFSGGGTPTLSAAEKKKAALIENFTFPADRASMLEALLFLKSKIAFLASEKPKKKSVFWLRLWTTKAEELSEKAALLLEGDKIAESARAEIASDKAHAEQKIKSRALIAIVLVVLHLALAGTVYGFAVPKILANLPEGQTEAPCQYPKTHLADALPDISADSIEVAQNSEARLHMNLTGVSPKEYKRFLSACKERFSAVSKETENSLEAHEADGHGHTLRLQYYESIGELQIIITEPA